jgi:uncharacterized protein YcnI
MKKKLITLTAAATVVAAVLAPLGGAHATVSMLQPQGKALTGARVAYILGVPNEKTKQDTTKVVLNVPASIQTAISLKQMPDWKAKLTRVPTGQLDADGLPVMAITKVTWTATKGNAIKPGFYGEWYFRVKNPADPQKLCFSIDQWYSAKKKGGRGELVSWSGASDSATPASCLDVVAS